MQTSWIAIPLVSVSSLFTACDRGSDPAQEPVKEESVEETKPTAQTETAPPALTEAAIESLIFDALSPTGEEVATVDGKKFSLNNLSKAQQETLNEAVTKAFSKIDFKMLLTSIASNLEIGGLDLNGLPGDVQVSARVFTPEEARKMGFGFKTPEGNDDNSGESGSGQGRVNSMQIFTIRSQGEPPFESGDPTTESSGRIQEISAMETPEDTDPERASRIQSLLESGDSDALAGELVDLIQTGIDTAALRQAIDGGALSPPKK